VEKKILVTAAGGNQGKILIPKAAKAGFTVRAMRRSKDADELLAIGASEVVIGDASNPNDVAKAMEGVSTVYHVGPTVHPNEKAMGLTVIEAAQKAGDKHLIYSSTMHAATSEMVPHRVKNEIEEQLVQSGVDFTILKPSGYMVPGFLQSAFAAGTLHVFHDPDRGQAKTNLDDFTDAVVKIASERDRHFAASYELNSDVCHSIHEIARMISEVTKKDIRHRGEDGVLEFRQKRLSFVTGAALLLESALGQKTLLMDTRQAATGTLSACPRTPPRVLAWRDCIPPRQPRRIASTAAVRPVRCAAETEDRRIFASPSASRPN
jgi:uncharacterized protein YbjT (DUF2867 family)